MGFEDKEDDNKQPAENSAEDSGRLPNSDYHKPPKTEKSVGEHKEEKDVDLITLDLPSPWNAIKPAEKALKIGGYLVSYSPTVPQVIDFVTVISNNDNFLYIKTCEIIKRNWDVEGRKVRPKSEGIGHSGFLTFCRKIR